MKAPVWIVIAIILVGAAVGVYLVRQKPSYIVTLSPGAGTDSAAVYAQRAAELEERLEATKAVLDRIQALDRPAVRRRIAHMEEQLEGLRAALREWREAHDAFGVGEAYRECLLLYGSAQAACHALSFDTLPE